MTSGRHQCQNKGRQGRIKYEWRPLYKTYIDGREEVMVTIVAIIAITTVPENGRLENGRNEP